MGLHIVPMSPRAFTQVLRALRLSLGHALCSLECPLALFSIETWKVFWGTSGIKTRHN